MTIFNCNSCFEDIPPEKARIHCSVCPAHDMCANCFVIERQTRDHTSDHAVLLFEMSGYLPRPPPVPPRPKPAAQHSAPNVPRRPVSTQVPPSGSRGNSPVISPGSAFPPPPPGPPPATSPLGGQPGNQGAAYVAGSMTPTAWQPLFNGVSPTPIMVAFLNEVFNHLDTNNSGLLSPEQYSAFLDVCQYLPNEDVWKMHATKPVYGYNPKDIADYELTQAYTNFSIDHRMAPSHRAPNNEMYTNLMGQISGLMRPELSSLFHSQSAPSMSGGQMPMLTRKGFIDITTIEVLGDPNSGWQYVNRIARHYGIWMALGECPRAMMPEVAPTELTDRIQRVTALARQKAQEAIEATRVRLDLEAQGRRHAEELVSDYRYEYVRR